MATFQIKGNAYSQHETEIACSLRIYLSVSDESIGSILGTRRNGLGSSPIKCSGLIEEIQQSTDARLRAVHDAVHNNRAQWEPYAGQVYHEWWDAHSQLAQRLQAQGKITEYLDTERGGRG
ncbi:hypothetical protein N7G274_000638 [Stereocaulon virgatum]|uniref:LAGLIDADG homing endonuclease n=1 Tax=Stereocaulon virgatum TaxID=373712 RepID=A0ABR4AS30_9LECA